MYPEEIAGRADAVGGGGGGVDERWRGRAGSGGGEWVGWEKREREEDIGWWFVFLTGGGYKVIFKIRVYYLFFISLSHLCFAGQFIFYVNLNVFRYEVR